ncbi:hypothetical protein RSAG8_01625, partial [Rhizoctonia solani AG-8 WAC10335]
MRRLGPAAAAGNRIRPMMVY